MWKITSLIFLILFLARIIYAHNANIVEYQIETGLSYGRSVIIFNGYQFGSSSTGWVSGSSTVNGGSSTEADGIIYITDLVGNKDFGFKNSGGSTTVNIYGYIGSSSTNFKINLAGFEMIGATNTTWFTDKDLEALLVEAICHGGTSTFSCGMTSVRER